MPEPLVESPCSIPVFQLGLFLRALCPARTGLRPARFTRALPEFKKKINLKKSKLILTK